MKLWTRVSVSLTTAATAVLVGAVSAGALPTDVQVQFDAATPAPGSSVEGDQLVAGVADALEGIERVDLYVVKARKAGTPPTGRPVDSQVEKVTGRNVRFALTWDAATAPADAVDVVVVVRTPTRTAQAEIPNLAVRRPAPAQRPVTRPVPQPAPVAGARRPAGRPGSAAAAPAPPVVAAPVVAAPAPQPAPQPAPHSDISAAQARAFYEVFSRTTYAEPGAPEQVTVSRARRAAAPVELLPWYRRISWATVGLGLLLLACAAFTARLARVGPREAVV